MITWRLRQYYVDGGMQTFTYTDSPRAELSAMNKAKSAFAAVKGKPGLAAAYLVKHIGPLNSSVIDKWELPQ